MHDSYCGLCNDCQLSSPDFQAAVTKVKTYLDRLPPHWQQQCRRDREDIALPEFRQGLAWFSSLGPCPGCKAQGGLKNCAIRDCATTRQHDNCYECTDHESCKHLIFV
jgi:hypothetical protein